DVGHELHHVLRGDHPPGHGRVLVPGDDHAADEEDAGDHDPGDRVGPRLEELELEQQHDEGRVHDAQDRYHDVPSFPAGCSRGADGFRKAQIRASGQRIPSVATPSQPATVTAAACGWPRLWAIGPGSDPSETTMTTAATRSTAKTAKAIRSRTSIMVDPRP